MFRLILIIALGFLSLSGSLSLLVALLIICIGLVLFNKGNFAYAEEWFWVLILISSYYEGTYLWGENSFLIYPFSLFLGLLLIPKRIPKISLYIVALALLGVFNIFTVKWFMIELFQWTIFFVILFSRFRSNRLHELLIYVAFIYYPLRLIYSYFAHIDYFDESSALFTLVQLAVVLERKTIMYLVVMLLTLMIKLAAGFLGSFEILGFGLLLLWSGGRRMLVLFLLPLMLLIQENISLFTFGDKVNHKFGQLFTFFELFDNRRLVSLVPFSIRVRILEFWRVFSSVDIHTLIGRGIGSYYTYEPSLLHEFGIYSFEGTDSYTKEELELGMYKTAHNSIPYIANKAGLVGLISFFHYVRSFIYTLQGNIFGKCTIIYAMMNIGFGLKNYIVIAFLLNLSYYEGCKTASHT